MIYQLDLSRADSAKILDQIKVWRNLVRLKQAQWKTATDGFVAWINLYHLVENSMIEQHARFNEKCKAEIQEREQDLAPVPNTADSQHLAEIFQQAELDATNVCTKSVAASISECKEVINNKITQEFSSIGHQKTQINKRKATIDAIDAAIMLDINEDDEFDGPKKKAATVSSSAAAASTDSMPPAGLLLAQQVKAEAAQK
jgi:hypothetical protein